MRTQFRKILRNSAFDVRQSGKHKSEKRLAMNGELLGQSRRGATETAGGHTSESAIINSMSTPISDSTSSGMAAELATAEKFCILGAGSSGLAVAKNFLAAGIAFDCLEREDDVGGNW